MVKNKRWCSSQDLIVTKASLAKSMNVFRGIGDTLMKSEIVKSIALTQK